MEPSVCDLIVIACLTSRLDPHVSRKRRATKTQFLCSSDDCPLKEQKSPGPVLSLVSHICRVRSFQKGDFFLISVNFQWCGYWGVSLGKKHYKF